MGKIRDKYVLIFGAGFGLGKTLTQHLAKQGRKVLAVDRNEDLSDADSLSVKKYIFDIKKDNWYQELELFIKKNNIELDGMVVYSGVTSFGGLRDTEQELLDQLLLVNTKLPFLATKLFLSCCSKLSNNSIVYIGTPHQFKGEEDRSAYAYSKSPITTLCKSVSEFQYKNSVRANVLIMGWTKTEGEIDLRSEIGQSNIDLALLSSQTPIGRLIQPEEYHATIDFLLSDKSVLISGSVIHATGGFFI